MKKPIFVVSIVVALVVGMTGGYFLGYAENGATYAPEIAEINKEFPQLTDVQSLTGQVEAINGMTLTVKVNAGLNPLVSGGSQVEEVTATDATKITQVASPEAMAQFREEMQAYLKKIASLTSSQRSSSGSVGLPTPPTPPNPATIAFSGIAVGDTVAVTAGSNILNVSSFTATSISVLSSAMPVSSASSSENQ